MYHHKFRKNMKTISLERKHHNVEHLSPEWFALRLERFTSSKAENLLMNGKAKDTVGLSFYTYIYETVEDALFGEEENFENDDTRRGNELEPIAFEEFRRKMAMEFRKVEKCGFFTLGDHEGSSPDGLVDDDGVLEIKAPRRRKFFEIVRRGLEAVDKSWKEQVQHQMRVTGRTRAYLVFIYVSDDGISYTHSIEVGICIDTQAKFEERLPIAIKEKEEYKQYLINKQWN